MSDKQMLQTFGVHRQDEFIWLHEQHRVLCLTPGYDGLPSPFEVRVPPRLRCPHSLVLPEPAALTLPDAPWVRLCAPVPIPEPGIYWCHPSQIDRLAEAARWMIPRVFDTVVHPWWGNAVSSRTLAHKIHLTNVAPLIVTDYHPSDFQEVLGLARLPRTRPLIFSGYPKLMIAVDITPDPSDTVSFTPSEWMQIGSAYLHEYVTEETVS